MIFAPLALEGVWLITPERLEDTRGFFARLLSRSDLARHGLTCDFEEESVAFNRSRGTIRGLHYQCEPHAETKIVRCTKGAIFDVVVDLRRDSLTFGRWVSVVLDDEQRASLYVPPGFAHGYQTLADDTEVSYRIAPGYELSAARGVNYADPELAIAWPIDEVTLSQRDAAHPKLARASAVDRM